MAKTKGVTTTATGETEEDSEEEEERLKKMLMKKTQKTQKKELNDLISLILLSKDEDDAATDRAILVLNDDDLRSISSSSNSSSSSSDIININNNIVIPDEFRCPISNSLFTDPVILSSGLTYDRPFIEKWLKQGNRTCPQTQQVLSHTLLTPNLLVRQLIQRWCNDHHITLPTVIHQHLLATPTDRCHLHLLLDKISSSSSSLSDQKSAAKQLRLLTKRTPSFRALFTDSYNSISQLLNPLSLNKDGAVDPDLHEDLITTLLNISIHDDNKKPIAEDPLVIPIIIESLKLGTVETRSSAAAALFTLSALDSNKAIIGKSGAITPLIELLDEGHPLAIKDAASAIFNLCVLSENRGRAVRNGAVNAIFKKIQDRVLVDELLAILALISGHQQAIEDMDKLGAMACFFSIIKENTCERNKENCIAMIYNMCLSDRSKLWEVWEEERVNRTISKIAQSGTSRAKRKANGLLEKLNKTSLLAHSA